MLLLLCSTRETVADFFGNRKDDKLSYLNVNDVLNPVKRSKILSKMKKEKAHIVYLQETHLNDKEHEKLKKIGFTKIFFSSYKSNHKRGGLPS